MKILPVNYKKAGDLLKKFLLLLGTLNMIDALATHYGLSIKVIEEINPIMNKLYEFHPYVFVGTKAILSFALYFLMFFKQLVQTPFLWLLVFLATTLYTAVLFLHMIWLGYSLFF